MHKRVITYGLGSVVAEVLAASTALLFSQNIYTQIPAFCVLVYRAQEYADQNQQV